MKAVDITELNLTSGNLKSELGPVTTEGDIRPDYPVDVLFDGGNILNITDINMSYNNMRKDASGVTRDFRKKVLLTYNAINAEDRMVYETVVYSSTGNVVDEDGNTIDAHPLNNNWQYTIEGLDESGVKAITQSYNITNAGEIVVRREVQTGEANLVPAYNVTRYSGPVYLTTTVNPASNVQQGQYQVDGWYSYYHVVTRTIEDMVLNPDINDPDYVYPDQIVWHENTFWLYEGDDKMSLIKEDKGIAIPDEDLYPSTDLPDLWTPDPGIEAWKIFMSGINESTFDFDINAGNAYLETQVLVTPELHFSLEDELLSMDETEELRYGTSSVSDWTRLQQKLRSMYILFRYQDYKSVMDTVDSVYNLLNSKF
jgi:hypothetical protein